MRVIAGTYRRRTLAGPDGQEARPTSDRLRETLFNILQPVIEGARFLDLCAGSGAVGIEALSRGAAHTTFVDQAPSMTALIRRNLAHCGVPEGQFQVVNAEAARFLARGIAEGGAGWDLIYFDPPYAHDPLPELQLFGDPARQLLLPGGRLMIEHDRKNTLPAEMGALCLIRTIRQGGTQVAIYDRK